MNKLDWTKWAALAEILSSIAIVATLFYLAVQTSQNTAAIQAASRQGVLNGELWMLDKMIEYPTLAPASGLINRPELSEDDNRRYENMLNGQFRIRENLWFQYQNGALDKATWESYRNIFVLLLLSNPDMQQYWETLSRFTMDQNFVAEIDGALANTTELPPLPDSSTRPENASEN